MAAARGDVAHHVGDERSASGGKQGDIVIEIDAASGAAEGPHRDRREGREAFQEPRLGRSLNAALAERDAGFAILLVASDEKVPSGREQLHEYEGNKMIVALDKETLDPARPRACLPLRALPLPDGGRARPRARRRRACATPPRRRCRR